MYSVYLCSKNFGKILYKKFPFYKAAFQSAAMKYRGHQKMVDVYICDPKGKIVSMREAKFK